MGRPLSAPHLRSWTMWWLSADAYANGVTTSPAASPWSTYLRTSCPNGGRRQTRVTGNLNGAAFTGSTMLVAGGGLCVGVSKAALKVAQAAVGDEVRLDLRSGTM